MEKEHKVIDLTTVDPKTTDLLCEIYPDGEMFIENSFQEQIVWLNPEQITKLYQALKDHLYPND